MSKVYFIPAQESEGVEAVTAKLGRLLDASDIFSAIKAGGKTAVKIHFGEEGNTGHVRWQYAAYLCSRIKEKGSEPFLSDTNTLYKGRRANSSDHIKVAAEHGFTRQSCGADIIVPEEKEAGIAEVDTAGKFVRKAKVFRIYLDAGALIDIAHFKGHMMTGFGGALKNIGMGCASREGKLVQHSDVAPIVALNRCEACLECVKHCPSNAIEPRDRKVYIDAAKCIGCAECIGRCSSGAITVDWEAGGSKVSDKMAEYAAALIKTKKGRMACVNFATNITKECDCLAGDDPRIVPDIGIFASSDPVAIDKACYDKVLETSGKDIFKILHPKRDGMAQLKHAANLGAGELQYDLIEVK